MHTNTHFPHFLFLSHTKHLDLAVHPSSRGLLRGRCKSKKLDFTHAAIKNNLEYLRLSGENPHISCWTQPSRQRHRAEKIKHAIYSASSSSLKVLRCRFFAPCRAAPASPLSPERFAERDKHLGFLCGCVFSKKPAAGNFKLIPSTGFSPDNYVSSAANCYKRTMFSAFIMGLNCRAKINK